MNRKFTFTYEHHPFRVIQYRGFGFLNNEVMNNGKSLKCTFIANNGTSSDESL